MNGEVFLKTLCFNTLLFAKLCLFLFAFLFKQPLFNIPLFAEHFLNPFFFRGSKRKNHIDANFVIGSPQVFRRYGNPAKQAVNRICRRFIPRWKLDDLFTVYGIVGNEDLIGFGRVVHIQPVNAAGFVRGLLELDIKENFLVFRTLLRHTAHISDSASLGHFARHHRVHIDRDRAVTGDTLGRIDDLVGTSCSVNVNFQPVGVQDHIPVFGDGNGNQRAIKQGHLFQQIRVFFR